MMKFISSALFLAFLASSVAPATAWSYWSPPTPSPPPPKNCDPTPAPQPALRATPAPTMAPTRRAPNTDAPTSAPVSQPQVIANVEADVVCGLSDTIQLEDNVFLRQGIDSATNTLTAQLFLAEEAWIGMAFSPNGLMVENQAVIGLPDAAATDNNNDESSTGGGGGGVPVGYYNLGARSPDGVTLLDDDQNKLLNASIEQEPGLTTMTFTLDLLDENGVPIVESGDTARIIYAYGSSNTLGFHAFRSSTEVSFTECIAAAA